MIDRFDGDVNAYKSYMKGLSSSGGKTVTENTHNRGFGTHKELARIVGSKGGKISKRTKTN